MVKQITIINIDSIHKPITGWTEINKSVKKPEYLKFSFKIKLKIKDESAKLNIP